MTDKQESIGALWEKEGRKGKFLSGTIGGKQVICFHNDNKTGNQPDWKVFPQRSREELPAREPGDDTPF